jgi:hypothetical protein
MFVDVEPGSPIRNAYAPPPIANNLHESSQEVIVQLDYADLWRTGRLTLYTNALVRLDQQGDYVDVDPNGGGRIYNIQVQVNGVRGNSTIAAALVYDTIQTDDPENQKGIVRKVVGALNQSLDTGHICTVKGGKRPLT